MKRIVLLLVAITPVLLVCYQCLRKEEASDLDYTRSNRLLVKQRSDLYLHHWSEKRDRPMVHVNPNLPTLSPEVVSGVKKFVFFVGYPRSGHSIVGSILDAHPHIVISHEFMLMDRESIFSEPPTQNWTSDLFNVLYQHSYMDSFVGIRNKYRTEKGYALNIEGLWQGRYDGFVDVIGDKSGGGTSARFLYDQLSFEYNYRQLVARLPVPIKVVHVMRNPYDMISTATIYAMISKDVHLTDHDFATAKKILNPHKNSSNMPRTKKFINATVLGNQIRAIFKKISGALKIAELVGEENVLTIHSSDLVHSPRETILRMCAFFQVNVPDLYLKVATEKVYKTVSRTRELVEWPEKLVATVADRMKPYTILHRYNFTSD